MLPTLAHACIVYDLPMTKSGPASVQPGGVVVYTVTVTNSHASKPIPVTMTDSIPSGLTFNSAQSSPGCRLLGSTKVLCSLGDASASVLAPGQTVAVKVAFNVPSNPAQCVIENQAKAGAFVPPRDGAQGVSNTVTTQINCVTSTPPPPGSTPTPTSPPTPKEEAKLSIDKVDNRDNNATQRGDIITYKITVKNSGEVDIQDLEINDAVPAGFEIDKKSVTSGATFVGQNIRWAGVALAAGGSKSFTVKVKVTEAAALKGLCNQVTATSADHGLSAKDQECIQVKKPPEVKQAIISVPKAVPVSAKTGGVLTTAMTVALVAAAGAVVWQLKQRGIKIPVNWLGGTIIVGAVAIILFGLGGSWIKSQVAFKLPGPICSCVCQGSDENLLCADPVGALPAQCNSFAYTMPAPADDAALCEAFQGTQCSFDGVNIGTVADCNGSP